MDSSDGAGLLTRRCMMVHDFFHLVTTKIQLPNISISEIKGRSYLPFCNKVWEVNFFHFFRPLFNFEILWLGLGLRSLEYTWVFRGSNYQSQNVSLQSCGFADCPTGCCAGIYKYICQGKDQQVGIFLQSAASKIRSSRRLCGVC